MSNPYVFLVGSPRSGTTLLDELGYPRGSAQVRPKTLDQAARPRDLFALDVDLHGCLSLQME